MQNYKRILRNPRLDNRGPITALARRTTSSCAPPGNDDEFAPRITGILTQGDPYSRFNDNYEDDVERNYQGDCEDKEDGKGGGEDNEEGEEGGEDEDGQKGGDADKRGEEDDVDVSDSNGNQMRLLPSYKDHIAYAIRNYKV